jgi:hypothetical protein
MTPIVKLKRYQNLIHQTYQDFTTIRAKICKQFGDDLKHSLRARIKKLTDNPHIKGIVLFFLYN